MSGREAKGAENNEIDCDNPISLDEIEKGLWLGAFHVAFNWKSNKSNVFMFIFDFQEVSLLQLISKH